MRTQILIAAFAFATCICGLAHAATEERDVVRLVALRYLMTKHAEFGKEREHYSAYVLKDVSLVKEFSSFRPMVVPFAEGRFPTSSGQAIDASTGRRVKIWSIGGEKIEGQKATVGIKWYSASLAAGWHTVFLVKKDGVWIVERERMDAVSQKPNKAPEPTTMAVTIRAPSSTARASHGRGSS
jgi:hypothetical protein